VPSCLPHLCSWSKKVNASEKRLEKAETKTIGGGQGKWNDQLTRRKRTTVCNAANKEHVREPPGEGSDGGGWNSGAAQLETTTRGLGLFYDATRIRGTSPRIFWGGLGPYLRRDEWAVRKQVVSRRRRLATVLLDVIS